ncbi:hypothetical protein [Streptomyces sp. NPDC057854]|uniref:hypothetical protein n=1 Tax=unclassified Streptomyces TaxID=2593676 RepID=UPI00369886C4
MNIINAGAALVALAAGLYFTTRGDWIAAAFFWAGAVHSAWCVDWRDKPPAREVEDVLLPDYLGRGVEPVETPTDVPPLTWADHDRDCETCRRKETA